MVVTGEYKYKILLIVVFQRPFGLWLNSEVANIYDQCVSLQRIKLYVILCSLLHGTSGISYLLIMVGAAKSVKASDNRVIGNDLESYRHNRV